jgi:hypothetical protein
MAAAAEAPAAFGLRGRMGLMGLLGRMGGGSQQSCGDKGVPKWSLGTRGIGRRGLMGRIGD